MSDTRKVYKWWNHEFQETSIFHCFVRKRQTFKLFREKDNLKISQQRDLLEYMAWWIGGSLKFGQTHKHVVESIGVTSNVIERVRNEFQEICDGTRRPEKGCARTTIGANDRLTAY